MLFPVKRNHLTDLPPTEHDLKTYRQQLHTPLLLEGSEVNTLTRISSFRSCLVVIDFIDRPTLAT